MKVTELTYNQLPPILASAMKVKNAPAFYVGPRADSKEAEQTADTAIEAVVKCFIEKKLGSEI